MLKASDVYAFNISNSIRGMRNPMESWDKSDSRFENGTFKIGQNDMALAVKLIKAGSDHRKFLRQMFICMDVSAPSYWWKEYATYKVGTVENSTSTMHKLGTRLLTPEDFSWDDEDGTVWDSSFRQNYLQDLNVRIACYQQLKTDKPDKAKILWRRIIQDLPESFNYLRTASFSYENARHMYHSRCNHKLEEWHQFCDILTELPYSYFIVVEE